MSECVGQKVKIVSSHYINLYFRSKIIFATEHFFLVFRSTMTVNLSTMPSRTTLKMNWLTYNGKRRSPTKFRKNVLPKQTMPRTTNRRNARQLHWNSVIVCGANIHEPVQRISKTHHRNAPNCDRNWTLALNMISAITIDITVTTMRNKRECGKL